MNLLTVDSHEIAARLRYFRIDSATSEALREFWPAVKRALPDVLDGFYRHLASEPALARLVGSQAERLKTAQGAHWARLFDGRFDESYVRGVRSIGLAHHKIGLELRWYIGGYTFVLSRLTELAIDTYGWRKKRAREVIAAVHSAVMLDMDLAISVYQHALLEEREKRQVTVERMIVDFEQHVTGALGSFSAASSQLKATAGSMAETADDTKRQAVAVAAASAQALSSVQSVALAGEELASSVDEIGRQVHESARIAVDAVKLAQGADTRIGSLSEAAAKIGNVVDLINKIAGQTNLLALNATIEAARAGDAGRGFAVVAAEVKSLAEQTSKATSEIAQQVSGIQSATQESVATIKEVGGIIGRISEISSTIASAVEEQGAATQEITRNIQEAADGAGGVSSGIASVSQAAIAASAAYGQVRAVSAEVSQQGVLLGAEVDRFLAGIRAA